MDELVINCKGTEYFSRFHLALYLGNREKARKLALTTLIMYRHQARIAHGKTESIRSEIRSMKRSVKKMAAEGMKFPFGEMRIKKLEGDQDAAEKELARIGEEIHCMLELWQSVGATFDDLCNLCNRDPVQVRKQLRDEHLDESLSKLAMIYNLDYKNPHDTGWLEDSVDAPLTHALKAYLLDTMLHTEAGRKASHEALEAVFPEIMDKALMEYTDADGVRHLIDKDGVEVSTLDGEEGKK